MRLIKKLYICFSKPQENIMKTKRISHKRNGKKLQPDKVETSQITTSITPTIVRLANMSTGRVVRMGSKAATMLSVKYPKEFKIL